MTSRTLLAVLAHPDDESLGFGGTLAKYAAEGVRVHLVTATRGDRGRYRGKPPGDPAHPGPAALAGIREAELRDAARALGIHEVSILGYPDGGVDRVDAARGRRGHRAAHPADSAAGGRHVWPGRRLRSSRSRGNLAVHGGRDRGRGRSRSQTAGPGPGAGTHAVSKFYYLTWPAETWDAYHAAIGVLRATVDGVERQAVPWPDWMITTVVDTRDWWAATWQAVSCHQSQVSAYERLRDVSTAHHEALWGRQSYYRVFSTVNGGRARETDLFDGSAVIARLAASSRARASLQAVTRTRCSHRSLGFTSASAYTPTTVCGEPWRAVSRGTRRARRARPR